MTYKSYTTYKTNTDSTPRDVKRAGYEKLVVYWLGTFLTNFSERCKRNSYKKEVLEKIFSRKDPNIVKRIFIEHEIPNSCSRGNF